MSLPLGWAIDLAVLRLKGAEVDEHADHLVVRSPDNPDYHWGNFVLVTDERAADRAEHWLDVFEAALPGARHRAIGLPGVPDPLPWRALGLEVETEEVLATARLPERRPRPEGYDVRELSGPEDWRAQVARAERDNARTGEHPAAEHRRYLDGRSRARQAVVAAGRGAWFGAFSGGELVADLGIVDCGEQVARYQDVATDEDHRRRGLAGHLLGVAAAWAAARGAQRWVILTESDNPAGRLYRAVGFEPTVPSAQAYRGPVAQKTTQAPTQTTAQPASSEAL